MYECPNCGGDLRFDIPSQMLKCEHCDAAFDPYSVGKEQDVEEHTIEVEAPETTGDDAGEAVVSAGADAPELSGEKVDPAGTKAKKTSGKAGNEGDAKGKRVLQVTIFTCKSCGAEISSTNSPLLSIKVMDTGRCSRSSRSRVTSAKSDCTVNFSWVGVA